MPKKSTSSSRGFSSRKARDNRNGDLCSVITSTSSHPSLESRLADRKERESIVLWKKPFTTLAYFMLELLVSVKTYSIRLWHNKKTVIYVLLFLVCVLFAYRTSGPHQKYVSVIKSRLFWWVYWIGLGILSSVGLGTGLHTFILYLGPHIAAVTMAAHECHSLKFPEPPYPDDIICPDDEDPLGVSMWSIMSKVRVEAFMWGVGTALGELPPYFMAKAARISGSADDAELEEFEALLNKKRKHEQMSWIERTKLSVEKIVERAGFLGILACASIPNPLFDLAGITCGHFLVPFWTFFGATVLGKAVIKMHIQKVFVILAFDEVLLEGAVSLLSRLPFVGRRLQEPFHDFLIKQKAKLHRPKGGPLPTENSLLAVIFEKLIILMVIYFVISLINSLAQNYYKRFQKERKRKKIAD